MLEADDPREAAVEILARLGRVPEGVPPEAVGPLDGAADGAGSESDECL
jgi:hypothetical protein